MRHYEIVFLVHPDQSDQVSGMMERYQNLVTEGGGSVHRAEDWGRRQLAYMINDVHKAHYAMLNVECSLDTLREIENLFQFNDAIIRSLVTKVNRPISDPSPIFLAKQAEDEAESRKAVEAKEREDQANSEDESSDNTSDESNSADDTTEGERASEEEE